MTRPNPGANAGKGEMPNFDREWTLVTLLLLDIQNIFDHTFEASDDMTLGAFRSWHLTLSYLVLIEIGHL